MRKRPAARIDAAVTVWSPRAVAAARGQEARAFWAESGAARPPGLW